MPNGIYCRRSYNVDWLTDKPTLLELRLIMAAAILIPLFVMAFITSYPRKWLTFITVDSDNLSSHYIDAWRNIIFGDEPNALLHSSDFQPVLNHSSIHFVTLTKLHTTN